MAINKKAMLKKIKMNKNKLLILLYMCGLCTSCSYSFMVRKERVIKEEKGFLLLAGYNHSTYKDLFVKTDSCGQYNIVECFESMKYHTGFKIGVGGIDYRGRLIAKYGKFIGYGFGDTLNKVYILPVKMEYTILDVKKEGLPPIDNPFQMMVHIQEKKIEINYYIGTIRTISIEPIR